MYSRNVKEFDLVYKKENDEVDHIIHSYNTPVFWKHTKNAKNKRWEIFLESKFKSYSKIPNVFFKDVLIAKFFPQQEIAILLRYFVHA